MIAPVQAAPAQSDLQYLTLDQFKRLIARGLDALLSTHTAIPTEELAGRPFCSNSIAYSARPISRRSDYSPLHGEAFAGKQTASDGSGPNPLLHHFLKEALVDYDDDYDGADLIGKYLTTKNRPIRMNLNFADGVSSDVLLPQRIDGVEAICDGIEMRIYCVALDATLPLKTLIGLPVEVQLVTDQGNLRRICGIVTEASQGESDGGLATYQLVMRDALAILDLSACTRVFLNQTELDVVKTVLAEVRRNNPALAATFEFEVDTALSLREYPLRQQIIQYNEGTGAFLRRLLKRRGISWFFRAGRSITSSSPEAEGRAPATPAHTMVLFQDARRLKPSTAGTIRFHRNSATEERDTITAWSGLRTLRPGRLSRYSWDYANPRGTDFMEVSVASNADQGAKGNKITAKLDHYVTEAPHVRDT